MSDAPRFTATGTRLDPILESVAARAEERFAEGAPDAVPDPPRGTRFLRALRANGLSVIAECKRRSPSAGDLAAAGAPVSIADRARGYAEGGAAALSILTERDHFHGHPDDLAAAESVGLPRLRKDFILSESMVVESVAMGADAILLLAVCLDDAQLTGFRAAARELGLAVLLEVHDETELERALCVDPDCIGVNARDLRTFEVDLGVSERLLPRIPVEYVRIAESGIREADDALRMRRAGADAVLVGEALMRANDPRAKLEAWIEVFGGGR